MENASFTLAYDNGDITSVMTSREETSAQQVVVPEGCRIMKRMNFVPWDNPENLMSREAQQTMDDLLKCVALPLCFIICVPTNILNMSVFYKQGLKERVNLCLFFLALSDLLVVTFYFASGSGAWLARLTGNPAMKMEISKIFMNNHLLIFAGFIYVSSFLSTVIAFERCFCVLSPLRSHTVLKARTMGVIILTGHVVILGIFVVAGLAFSVVCVYDPVSNTTLDLISASEFRENNPDFVTAIEGIVIGFVLPGLSLTGVTIATVVTVVKLKKMSNWRKQSTRSAVTMRTRDVALTRMLVGIGVLFIVCTFPGVVCHTAAVLIPGMTPGGRYHNTYFFLTSLQLLFVDINSSVNFFVYYNTGTRFRRTLHSLVRPGSGSKLSRDSERSGNIQTVSLQDVN